MMLTLSGQRVDAARCRELRLEGHLTKPVGQAELLEAILQVTSSKHSEVKPELVTRHSLRADGTSLRILLVEDNAVNKLLASRLLEKHGHIVVTTGNGREELERSVEQLVSAWEDPAELKADISQVIQSQ